MKFAINTNCLRNHFTHAEIVDIALQMGVDGIEWGLPSLENAPAAAAEMRKVTEDAGLEILSYINGGMLWDTEAIRRWSELVARNGGKMLRVAHPWYAWNYEESTQQPESFNVLLEKTRQGLEKLAALGREFGLRYVLETHSGSCFASPLAVKAVMDEFDPRYCGVIYDPANTYMEGFIRPRGAVEVMGDFLAYVHVKNMTIESGCGANGKYQVTYAKSPVECGLVDYEEIMFALKLAGYKGWFSFEELYSPPEGMADEVKSGIAHLRACRQRAPETLNIAP